jgi:hypothetical protein
MFYVTTRVYYCVASLAQVAFLPFGFLIDLWRWDVFSGKVTESQWNAHWWEIRWEFLVFFKDSRRKLWLQRTRLRSASAPWSGDSYPHIQGHVLHDFSYMMSPEARLWFFSSASLGGTAHHADGFVLHEINETYVSSVLRACDEGGTSRL